MEMEDNLETPTTLQDNCSDEIIQQEDSVPKILTRTFFFKNLRGFAIQQEKNLSSSIPNYSNQLSSRYLSKGFGYTSRECEAV